jgi:hypothetical protein
MPDSKLPYIIHVSMVSMEIIAALQIGVGLLITEDGKRTFQGYSPFTAEEYKIKLPPGAIPDPKKIEDTKG